MSSNPPSIIVIELSLVVDKEVQVVPSERSAKFARFAVASQPPLIPAELLLRGLQN